LPKGGGLRRCGLALLRSIDDRAQLYASAYALTRRSWPSGWKKQSIFETKLVFMRCRV
jgi:hypothetical protein